jgi:hypothetical protein
MRVSRNIPDLISKLITSIIGKIMAHLSVNGRCLVLIVERELNKYELQMVSLDDLKNKSHPDIDRVADYDRCLADVEASDPSKGFVLCVAMVGKASAQTFINAKRRT